MAPVATFSVHRSTIVAQALHHRFDGLAGMRSTGWAANASDALYRSSEPADVWVLDAGLCHSGAAVLCDRLQSEGWRTRVVILADLCEPPEMEQVLTLIERGASGVVDTSSAWPILVRAVEATADGLTWLPRQVQTRLVDTVLLGRAMDDVVIRSLLHLTEREREVFMRLCRGERRADVARSLYISDHTVRTHVQRVLAKFGVHSQRELIALGRRHRLAERFDDG